MKKRTWEEVWNNERALSTVVAEEGYKTFSTLWRSWGSVARFRAMNGG